MMRARERVDDQTFNGGHNMGERYMDQGPNEEPDVEDLFDPDDDMDEGGESD
jgi:hypothetical protein